MEINVNFDACFKSFVLTGGGYKRMLRPKNQKPKPKAYRRISYSERCQNRALLVQNGQLQMTPVETLRREAGLRSMTTFIRRSSYTAVKLCRHVFCAPKEKIRLLFSELSAGHPPTVPLSA